MFPLSDSLTSSHTDARITKINIKKKKDMDARGGRDSSSTPATVTPQTDEAVPERAPVYRRAELERLRPALADLFRLLDSDGDGRVDREALVVRAPSCTP